MPYLESAQIEFLIKCVEATKRIQPQRTPFFAFRPYGTDYMLVFHSGLQGERNQVYPGDLAALAEAGLIRRDEEQFDITPGGIAFYDELQRRGGRPETMVDRRTQFLIELREMELSTRDGWCDLVAVGASIGLGGDDSERIAHALQRDEEITFRSEQGTLIRSTSAAKRQTTMAVFDQRGQHVTYQYNAAGNINFGAVQDREELARNLENLRTEVGKAHEAGVIDEDTATDAAYHLTKAVQQASKPEPDKSRMLGALDQAKDIITAVSAAGGAATGLAAAVSQAAELVHKLF